MTSAVSPTRFVHRADLADPPRWPSEAGTASVVDCRSDNVSRPWSALFQGAGGGRSTKHRTPAAAAAAIRAAGYVALTPGEFEAFQRTRGCPGY